MGQPDPYDFFNYLGYWQGREYEDSAEKLALKKLFAKIPQRDSLIDIGGGFGRLSDTYVSKFSRCLLIDSSEKLLKQAKTRLKEYKNIKIQEGGAEDIPASTDEFDTALLIRLVHHFPEPLKAFKEACRVLKPGGFLILEFANKIHFYARVRAYLRGDFGFTRNTEPIDVRSRQSIAQGNIPFLNHHPIQIKKLLIKAGFEIKDQLSVSNLRHSLVKKIIPCWALLFLESSLQRLGSKIYFGPSIFFLARKKFPPR